MTGTIENTRPAFELVGGGCIVSLPNFDPFFATVNELVPRLGAPCEAQMLLTAISEAVETYDPKREAVLVVERGRAIDVLILGESGTRPVGGITFIASERETRYR